MNGGGYEKKSKPALSDRSCLAGLAVRQGLTPALASPAQGIAKGCYVLVLRVSSCSVLDRFCSLQQRQSLRWGPGELPGRWQYWSQQTKSCCLSVFHGGAMSSSKELYVTDSPCPPSLHPPALISVRSIGFWLGRQAVAASRAGLAPSVSLADILEQRSSAFKRMLLLSAVLQVVGRNKSPPPLYEFLGTAVSPGFFGAREPARTRAADPRRGFGSTRLNGRLVSQYLLEAQLEIST